MYIQKNKQRRGQSLFLSVARGEKPWVLEERSMVLGSTWQHLAAAPPQAHLSCTRDKKLARPATGRFGWLLGTKACTLAILHRQKIIICHCFSPSSSLLFLVCTQNCRH